MKEWIVIVSRSEAKIFERDNHDQMPRWLKTLTNKRGRRKEHELVPDHSGTVRFGSGVHVYQAHQTHAEQTANRFVHKLGRILRLAHGQKLFQLAIIFADPKLIGKFKKELNGKAYRFVGKNIEKLNTTRLKESIA